jgi:hypothetical protein
MAKTKHEEPDNSQNEESIAKIVVFDTIRDAHTNSQMHGDVTVAEILKLLKSNTGDLMTQGVISSYLLSFSAERASGVTAELDLRAAVKPVNITADLLKQEMIQQLQSYLDLEAPQRADFLQKVLTHKFPAAKTANAF